MEILEKFHDDISGKILLRPIVWQLAIGRSNLMPSAKEEDEEETTSINFH